VTLKAIVLCCAVLVAVASWTAASAQPAAASGSHLTKAEKTMLALLNHARTSRGRHALRVVSSLERASRVHSRDMLRRDYFSHDSHGGGSYAARLRAFGYSRAGCTTWKVGEIIGWGRGGAASARRIFRAWMKSPAHRRVILQRSFRDVGIGAVTGTLCGLSGVRMVTVDFGHRVK
jgi:uncharacterized protein YkwD